MGLEKTENRKQHKKQNKKLRGDETHNKQGEMLELKHMKTILELSYKQDTRWQCGVSEYASANTKRNFGKNGCFV